MVTGQEGRVNLSGRYVFPHVCSRCAGRKAVKKWTVKSPDIPGAFLLENQITIQTFEVPVCDLCYKELENAALARIAILVGGVFLGMIISAYLLQFWLGSNTNGLLFFFWIFLGAVLGLAFSAVLGLPLIDRFLNYKIARILNKGRGVRFTNRTYQQLFNRMNHLPVVQGRLRPTHL